VSFASVFTIVGVVLFLAPLGNSIAALELAPVAARDSLLLLLHETFYELSHLFLGFALGISPAAAWIAVTADSTCGY